MLNIRRTGPSMADVIRELQGVRTSLLPYAAATALTRCVKSGQAAVIEEMRAAFDNPVPYTLNATRIEVATVEKLTARIAVKDQVGRGTRPESYLLPEVQGGERNLKGLERGLLSAGLLRPGEYAMPAQGLRRDAAGNVGGSQVRTILRQVARGTSGKRGAGSGVFAGAAGRNKTRGLWQRDAKGLRLLFVFTLAQPRYQPRFDFTGAAERSVKQNFASSTPPLARCSASSDERAAVVDQFNVQTRGSLHAYRRFQVPAAGRGPGHHCRCGPGLVAERRPGDPACRRSQRSRARHHARPVGLRLGRDRLAPDRRVPRAGDAANRPAASGG